MKTIFIVFVIFVSSLINPDNKNKNFKINYIEKYVKSEKKQGNKKQERRQVKERKLALFRIFIKISFLDTLLSVLLVMLLET